MSDVAAATVQTAAQPASTGLSLWSHGSFGFKDLLDIVNPLQHVPIIGSIYRYLTGDEPSGGARIIGDTIYGGPIGFGVSVVSTALFTDQHGDLGEKALAAMFGPRDDSPTLGTPAIAAAPPASTSSAPAPASATTALAAPAPLAAGPPQPVAMNQLFRSPPPATATPQQAFLAQNAQLQRQVATGRGTNGAVLNNRPVPLELSSNLLPVAPAGGHLGPPPPAPAPASASSLAPASAATAAVAAPYALAQKMLDALDKYEQLKKQEEQEDSAPPGTAPRLDLAL